MLAQAAALPDRFHSELRTLCLTPDGRHGGAASQKGSTYNVISAASGDLEVVTRSTL